LLVLAPPNRQAACIGLMIDDVGIFCWNLIDPLFTVIKTKSLANFKFEVWMFSNVSVNDGNRHSTGTGNWKLSFPRAGR
jgi:hypothetical protein